MDDTKLNRALTWVGSGGTVLAVTTLLTAGVFAVTPEGQSPAAELTPCFQLNCTAGLAAPISTTSSTTRVAHAGRVTYAQARPANPAGLAPSAAPPAAAPAPKTAPKTAAWTTSLPEQQLAAPIVAMTRAKGGSLLMAGSDGGVFPVGEAGFYGSLSGRPLSQEVSAVMADPATGGYWLVGRDGGVFAFNASYHGSLSGDRLTAPVVGAVPTPSGDGYWLVSSDGGVFAFGDARWHGSLSGLRLTSPVVAMAATPSGNGYWLVSSDGGVFAFGDAGWHGALSRAHLSSPVVGAASTPSGDGYWLVSGDGGVFTFGDAPYKGNDSPSHLRVGVSALVPTPTGNGYWLADQNGRVAAFGDARPVQLAAPAQVITTVSTGATGPTAAQQSTHAAGVLHAAADPSSGPTAGAALATGAAPAAGPPRGLGPVRGHGEYAPGSTGMDISQYQCSSIPTGPAGIAVVQVTGGAIDNPPNSCYVQEADWAGIDMSAYLYMDGLPSPPPAQSLSGPAGQCAVTNIACASFNYGYVYARYWVAYSRSVGVDPDQFWLDVERYSGWGDAVSNRLVVAGALQGLRSMHVATGIYSTTTQWQQITGGMRIPGVDEWTPGAGNLTGPGYTATSFCTAPGAYTFGGGRLKMVQYGYTGPFPGSYSGSNGYDLDYSC